MGYPPDDCGMALSMWYNTPGHINLTFLAGVISVPLLSPLVAGSMATEFLEGTLAEDKPNARIVL